MALKPFYAKDIQRYGDCAFVRISYVEFREDGSHTTKEVMGYETLSRGATASANREIKRLNAKGHE